MPGKPASYPSAKGTVFLWEAAPRVVVTRVVGVLTAEGAQAIEMSGRRALAKYGTHTAFHDWEAMTDYEPEARAKLTNFGVEILKTLRGVHIFSRSTVVRLGVQAAGLVIRRIRLHDARQTFEDELRRALMEARAGA